jgi:hypothetical protein
VFRGAGSVTNADFGVMNGTQRAVPPASYRIRWWKTDCGTLRWGASARGEETGAALLGA